MGQKQKYDSKMTKKFPVMLTKDQAKILKDRAKKSKKTMGQVIREALGF